MTSYVLTCGPELEGLRPEAVAISCKKVLGRNCYTWNDYLMNYDRKVEKPSTLFWNVYWLQRSTVTAYSCETAFRCFANVADTPFLHCSLSEQTTPILRPNPFLKPLQNYLLLPPISRTRLISGISTIQRSISTRNHQQTRDRLTKIYMLNLPESIRSTVTMQSPLYRVTGS